MITYKIEKYNREISVKLNERESVNITENSTETLLYTKSLRHESDFIQAYQYKNKVRLFRTAPIITDVINLKKSKKKSLYVYAYIERQTQDEIWLRDNTGSTKIKYCARNKFLFIGAKLVLLHLEKNDEKYVIKLAISEKQTSDDD